MDAWVLYLLFSLILLNVPSTLGIMDDMNRQPNRRSAGQPTRRELHEKQKGLCFYCDYPLRYDIKNAVHYDHFTPVSRGGGSDASNFVASCWICNGLKRDTLFLCKKLAKLAVQRMRVEGGLPRDHAHWVELEDALLAKTSAPCETGSDA